MEDNTPILNHLQILQKVNRIAYQIYEDHYDQKEIIVAGIATSGLILAKMLQEKLTEISPIQIRMVELHIDKKNPIKQTLTLDISEKELKNKAVIVVDDVLDRKSTRLNSSHVRISYAVFCLKK